MLETHLEQAAIFRCHSALIESPFICQYFFSNCPAWFEHKLIQFQSAKKNDVKLVVALEYVVLGKGSECWGLEDSLQGDGMEFAQQRVVKLKDRVVDFNVVEGFRCWLVVEVE